MAVDCECVCEGCTSYFPLQRYPPTPTRPPPRGEAVCSTLKSECGADKWLAAAVQLCLWCMTSCACYTKVNRKYGKQKHGFRTRRMRRVINHKTKNWCGNANEWQGASKGSCHWFRKLDRKTKIYHLIGRGDWLPPDCCCCCCVMQQVLNVRLRRVRGDRESEQTDLTSISLSCSWKVVRVHFQLDPLCKRRGRLYTHVKKTAITGGVRPSAGVVCCKANI